MATFEKHVKVSGVVSLLVHLYLDQEPENKETCFGEDETVSITVKFPNDYEMDIKMCGVQYEPGSTNTAWTEAVLFRDGSEVCCSEPSDAFFGWWALDYDGDTYAVFIEDFTEDQGGNYE